VRRFPAFGVAGAVIGGILGFLARPSIPIIGRLPLDAVLTRASTYHGLASGYIHRVADRSLAILILGAVVGGLLGYLADRTAERVGGGLRACPHCAEQIRAQARVCRFCGNSVVSE
jgi:uncharacterized membrane protein (UPF0136 family)